MNNPSSDSPSDKKPEEEKVVADRRKFFAASSAIAMGGGIAASYGTLAVMAGKYLYPLDKNADWQFVCTVSKLKQGETLDYVTATGIQVVVSRQGAGETAKDFVALSSICPHLGCKVHWEPQNDRFFCPCHNGAFDKEGNPTEGPPLKAKQQLIQFPLEVRGAMLFILAPIKKIMQNDEQTASADHPLESGEATA